MSLLEEPGHLAWIVELTLFMGKILSFDSALHPVLLLMMFLLLFWFRGGGRLQNLLLCKLLAILTKHRHLQKLLSEYSTEYLGKGQIRILSRQRTCYRESLSQPYATDEYSTDPRRIYGTVINL
uniref:Uncharacterized protein n=1 Tax=Glossina palpalis gambiensis TaxID=67801 RepID=A0A1B0C1Y9_9MUSC